MSKLSPDQLDPRNNLQWYTRTAIRNADVWTPQMIRSEYSRLRDIAQKRLKRLGEAEPESYAYTSNVGRYAPVRGLSTEEAEKLLPDLAKFIAAKTGTVRGIRQQRQAAVKTLQARGYTGITQSNIKLFGQFMEEWRQSKLVRSVGSPDTASAFEFMQKHDIPWEYVKANFAEWLREQKKLRDYVGKQNKKGRAVTSDEILQRFEELEAQRKAKNAKARERRAKKSGR